MRNKKKLIFIGGGVMLLLLLLLLLCTTICYADGEIVPEKNESLTVKAKASLMYLDNQIAKTLNIVKIPWNGRAFIRFNSLVVFMQERIDLIHHYFKLTGDLNIAYGNTKIWYVFNFFFYFSKLVSFIILLFL